MFGCEVGPCSRFCACYSIIGAMFTLFVGMLLSTQPFFVGGIKFEEYDLYRGNAFGAMGIFIVTFGLSIFGLCYDATCKRRGAADPIRVTRLPNPVQEYRGEYSTVNVEMRSGPSNLFADADDDDTRGVFT
eukprot:CAMPEP_0195530862 /NCGR_PEP_ID=MMETSP0794_2-20130614/33957_1 /TAXON_ID=515487 /ORGANISM="Stephanopyxis turris, Strain CCMP 815" /LENGTH=130 /DNA_ID=CAMNT_0040662469 /DNA_START=182 /DNA_END=574 /DNA_ORIENTATION=+